MKYFRKLMLVCCLLLISCAYPSLHEDWLFNKVGSNTVFIHSPPEAKLQGSATGFEVIAPSGKIYTLTNAHVCGLESDGVVMVGEKRHSGRLIPRRIIEVYQDNDLCLVEGLEGYEGLSLASGYEIGDLNYAIGYPLGEAMNISSGFLKEVRKVQIALNEIDPSDCKGDNMRVEKVPTLFGPIPVCMMDRISMQTNIPIFPGNSGSPMVNSWGHITGVIFASNNQTFWGSAVPLSYVTDFLKAY